MQHTRTVARGAEDFALAYSLHPASGPPSSSPLPQLLFAHPFNNSREYWQPQLDDPALAPYTKIVLDSIGFAASATGGRAWDFDLAAASILDLLEHHFPAGPATVVVGDSMGGGPTGLRCALLDAERVKAGGLRRILGVVACGTSAEEESADFVAEYSLAAQHFAAQCLDAAVGPSQAISDLARNMARDGYTPSDEPRIVSSREWGAGVIERSLRLTLASAEGVLEPVYAGRTMVTNYDCLDYRPSLIPLLAVRPSPLLCPILVIHGSLDKAYPLERGYHLRTVDAIGDEHAELLVVQGGPHFVTVTHWEEVDAAILDWIRRRC